MDVEEIQTQPCKFSRVNNGGNRSNKMVEEDDDDNGGDDSKNGLVDSRVRGWHNSSRIFRVSRASGGKDRHSKVLTSKGLRDRRVRLSVSTAIAFYDLQDRLGYDQPSKAVEWLIKAADDAIAELPSLTSPFSDVPAKELLGVAGGDESKNVEFDNEYSKFHHQRQLSLSQSACSSTSETSKGSGLSASRFEARVNREKARVRARERATKERENESGIAHLHTNSSFTELLTTSSLAQQNPCNGDGGGPDLFHKSARQWPPSSTQMDYLTTGLFGPVRNSNYSNSGFSGQFQFGNPSMSQSMTNPPSEDSRRHQQPGMQHFSFISDNLNSVAAGQLGGGSENHNLNFTISSAGFAGFNRGTLQSNSSLQPSFVPHLQRFSLSDGSSNAPFFIGEAVTPPPASMENGNNNNHHHHYRQFVPPEFEGSLQLYHGDETRHSDLRGKGKN